MSSCTENGINLSYQTLVCKINDSSANYFFLETLASILSILKGKGIKKENFQVVRQVLHMFSASQGTYLFVRMSLSLEMDLKKWKREIRCFESFFRLLGTT